eukprot:GHVS01057408.1.p1 GENE.GHVS01057408.1~~GHVS01057408.1.p1  ORF type:complete len:1124 (+),score=185.36 GHVS01057408.1:170-3541(+)
MDEVVKALDALCCSTDREQQHAADKWLREWQKSSQTWQVATAILSEQPTQTEEVCCFAAQTLRSKIMYDFVELPSEYHETLGTSLIAFVKKFHQSLRVMTMLSLALADLSIQTAKTWASPVTTFLTIFAVPDSTPADGQQLFDDSMVKALLLLFKHLPEENHNRRVMADHSARSAHRLVLQNDKLMVFSFLTEIVRPRAQLTGSLMADALDCWKSWINNLQLSPTDVYKSPFLQDCFKILLCSTGPLPPAGPQGCPPPELPTGYTNKHKSALEDSARECLCAILRQTAAATENYTSTTNNDDGDINTNSSSGSCTTSGGSDERAIQHMARECILGECLDTICLNNGYFSLCVGRAIKQLHNTVAVGDEEITTTTVDDAEGVLSMLTDICVQVGFAHINRFISDLHTDARLQTMLSILMTISTASSFAISDATFASAGGGGMNEVGGTWFWYKLSEQIDIYRKYKHSGNGVKAPLKVVSHNIAECITTGGGSSGGGSGGSSGGSSGSATTTTTANSKTSYDGLACDRNVAALCSLYDRLVDVAIVNCIASKCELTIEGYIAEDFADYRRAMIDCVRDCCAVLGSASVVNKVLDRFASADSNSVESYKYVREGSLFILVHIIRGVGCDPNEMPKMFLLVDNCADLLRPTPPEDALELTSRVTAVHLMADATLWMRDRPAALSAVVNQIIRQSLFMTTTANTNSVGQLPPNCDRLVLESIRAFKDICVSDGRSLHGMLDVLCNVARESRSSCGAGSKNNNEVHFCLLEGISVVASSLPDNTLFLQVLESLCNPLIDELKTDAADAAQVGSALDCLAIILKDVIPGVRCCSARGDSMLTFVRSTLWPILEVLLIKFAATSDRVAERCIRCLKHSVRCIEYRVQPLIPEIVRVVVSCAAVELQSCYLYCAEYLAMELQKVPDVQPLLNTLFNDLSDRALSVLEQHKDNLSDYPLLVEDCFGMFIRFLNFCPHIATNSPHFARALRLCEAGMYQDRKDSVSTVFVFLDNVVRGNLRSRCALPVADITVVVQQCLPLLVRQLFKLLLSAPPNDVLDHIDMVIQSIVEMFPQHSRLLLEAGLAELPTAVLSTAEMKTDTLNKICEGSRSLHSAIDEISYRCQQYAIRCGRS